MQSHKSTCLALIFTLFSATYIYAAENPNSEHPANQNETKRTQTPLQIIVVKTEEEKQDSLRKKNEEKNRDATAYKFQERNLVTAEKMVCLTIFQIFLTALGNIGLFITIFLNKKATKAAVEAANASIEALRAEQKPRLRFSEIVIPVAPGPLSGEFLVTNVGGFEADITNGTAGLFLHRGPLLMKNPIDKFDEKNPYTGKVGGGFAGWWKITGLELKEDDFKRIKSNQINLYLVGRAVYKYQILNVQNETHALFCFRYDSKADRFWAVDDPDYFLCCERPEPPKEALNDAPGLRRRNNLLKATI